MDDYLRWSEAQRGEYSLLSDIAGCALPSVYRPSARSLAAAASPSALAAGAPSPSLMAALRSVDASPELELWTDRLREWLAARLLQPLTQQLLRSHAVVERAVAACPRLPRRAPPALLQAEESYFRGGGGGGPGSPRTAGGSTRGGGGGADSDQAEAELRMLAEQLSGAPPGALSPDESYALDACVRHLALLALLRGTFPAGLLAPMPPQYVALRVRQLAQGSCCEAFSWSQGGDWPPGKPWSPELPDDSQLLLHLLTAFLLAPGWTFQAEHAGLSRPGAAAAAAVYTPPPTHSPSAPALPMPVFAGGRGGPLFVGALPASARAPEAYAAILVAPLRPPEAHAQALGLSFSRAAPPRFHVYGRGRELAATSGHNGLLHALVLFFLLAEREGGGALGPARLESPAVALASIFSEPGLRL